MGMVDALNCVSSAERFIIPFRISCKVLLKHKLLEILRSAFPSWNCHYDGRLLSMTTENFEASVRVQKT